MKIQTKAIRYLLILLLFPTVALISLSYEYYYGIQEIREDYNKEENRIEERKWDLIENSIDENVAKARLQSMYVKKEILNNIQYEYNGNNDRLYYDLVINRSKDSPLFSILNSSIKDTYLNINSENNRIYIADKYGIIADKGLISSSSKVSRDWDTEIESKHNQELAKNSLYIILTKQSNIAFWESVNPNDRYLTFANPDIENIKDLYIHDGVSSLKSFNVLVPSYITKDGDIFGVPDVNNHGQKNDNNTLVIIQEFNLYDSILSHKDDLDRYNRDMVTCKSEMNNRINVKIIIFVFVSIILLISFAALLFAANICTINRGGDDEFRCGINKS